MWAKLDDALIDHRKLYAAGAIIGRNGPAIALGFYAVGLMWTNKQLTDGFLPTTIVKSFRHVERPLAIANALADAQLWEAVDGGFRVHDFHDHNPQAEDVKRKRKADRERKRKNGHHG